MKILYQVLVRLGAKLNRKIIFKVSNKLFVAKLCLLFIVMCLLIYGVSPAFTQTKTGLVISEQTIPIDAIKIRTDPGRLAFDNWISELEAQGLEKTGTAFDSQPPQENNVVMSKAMSFPLGGDYWQDITYPIAHKGNGLDAPLWGFVDMHMHLMAHLGFGKKLIHGVPDIGSIIPAGTQDCNRVDKRATSIQEALGNDNSTHGKPNGLFDNPCGDFQRNLVLRALESANEAQSRHGSNSLGYSDDPSKAFVSWPKFNDITHQQLWVDWIQRTYQGGLRVMVALAVNNKTLADGINGDSPTDDKGSADLQIREIEQFVNRHNDFMEIATTPEELRSIVKKNKLAVIIGVEIDNIGNFNTVSPLSQEMISEEIKRLYDNKVRYIFPIHVIDNKFGGTAVYQDIFNYSNKREYGSFWDLMCAEPSDGITKQIKGNVLLQLIGITGEDAFKNPPIPHCPAGIGHKNRKGLTPEGEFAIKEMMKRGMIIDIDHMSQEAANQTLAIAETIPGGYPINAGHNGFRSYEQRDEYGRTDSQLTKISTLGGMMGVGWGNSVSCEFLNNFRFGFGKMAGKQLAIGTDINGLVKAPRPRNASSDCPGSQVNYVEKPGGLNQPLSMAQTGPQKWNYNTEGVAHYGLIPDFLQDLKNIGMTPQERSTLFMSAEYFAQMWEKSVRVSVNVK
jgi:microsomal dipeptidase-like Zn-dependent dipeptidase